MTESPTIPPTAPDGDVATVERAEAAWLEAVTAAVPHAMRRLMHPECVVVHAAAGHIDGAETFLQHTADMGWVTEIKTYDVTVCAAVRRVVIVCCLREMHVAYFPDRAPFVVIPAVKNASVNAPTSRSARISPRACLLRVSSTTSSSEYHRPPGSTRPDQHNTARLPARPQCQSSTVPAASSVLVLSDRADRRVEPRATVRAHLLGLLSNIEGKNSAGGWPNRSVRPSLGRCSACCATPMARVAGVAPSTATSHLHRLVACRPRNERGGTGRTAVRASTGPISVSTDVPTAPVPRGRGVVARPRGRHVCCEADGSRTPRSSSGSAGCGADRRLKPSLSRLVLARDPGRAQSTDSSSAKISAKSRRGLLPSQPIDARRTAVKTLRVAGTSSTSSIMPGPSSPPSKM